MAAGQAQRYSKSVGRGLTPEYIAEIIDFSSDVILRDWFKERAAVPFWYERFDKAGLTKRLSDLADVWVESEENIKRAADHVGRPPKPAIRDLVLAFGIYKFKEYASDRWELVKRPARSIDEAFENKESQTMVCIALEDLSPENGFPFQLQRGQDVCMDGNETLLLPPTGGGMAILIWIDL